MIYFLQLIQHRYSMKSLSHSSWSLINYQNHLSHTISGWIKCDHRVPACPSNLPKVENAPGFESPLTLTLLSPSSVAELFWSPLHTLFLSACLASQGTFYTSFSAAEHSGTFCCTDFFKRPKKSSSAEQFTHCTINHLRDNDVNTVIPALPELLWVIMLTRHRGAEIEGCNLWIFAGCGTSMPALSTPDS